MSFGDANLALSWSMSGSDRAEPPTAVQQGSEFDDVYPFLVPTSDVRGLISDFYLSYTDPRRERVLPLKLSWLHGFGSLAASPPLGSTPAHAYDLLVTDAEDNVVFDSSVATSYGEQFWGRRTVVEWQTATAVCRVVTGAAVDQWPADVVPADGRLDARTHERLPLRVQSVRLGAQTLTGAFTLAVGYNVSLTAKVTAGHDGGRRVTRIVVDCTPGGGLGKPGGCSPAEVLVRRINGVGPTAAGNFLLDLSGCYRAQLPLTVGEEAGQRVAHYGTLDLSADEALHALTLGNDCQPCCRCADYVNTYKGLQHVWDLWQAIAAAAEATRDGYQANRLRWQQYGQCSTGLAGRLVTLGEPAGTVQLAGAYCNNNPCCLRPVELRFTHLLYDGAVAVDWPLVTARAVDARVQGGSRSGFDAYVMSGAYPIFSAFLDDTEPGAVSLAQYRLCFTGATATMSLQTYLTVHVPDPGGDCPLLPTVEVPAAVQDLWLAVGNVPAYPARFVALRAAPLDPTPAGYGCGCPPVFRLE